MKIENNIGWTDATINAVTGCDKVSPGCKNCYAEAGTRARVLRAQGKETWGAKGERVPVNFEPVFRRLNKLCVCDKCSEARPFSEVGTPHAHCEHEFSSGMGTLRRIRLFADSNSDWLDPKWPVETLARFLDAIRLAPNVDVLLLTKRIENFFSQLQTCWRMSTANLLLAQWILGWESGRTSPPANVWLGVSVEDQNRADERIPLLLQTPAAIRFLSVEPLLEAVDLNTSDKSGPLAPVDWVIVGGESGKNRRDCGIGAILSVAVQCINAGVPLYVKQDSAFLSGQQGRIPDEIWIRKRFPQ